ncbi:MAG: ATP-binding cassette domain-containing protein [Peptostreptococcaceae bacterium]|nr:ATP-binding cassette domain-containing protein [Peptostreptococcaceae bacterium]
MAEEKVIISLQNVTKDFETRSGTIRALDNINIDIKQGETYGIIGLSGAGKSTLVRCINLLEMPTEGKVVFNGESLTGLKRKELNLRRREIAMIFQQFNLLMQRTSLQNVCFPLEIAGVKKAEAVKRGKELLKLVGLEDRAESYPAQLSGGQKQRVAIARALASNPKVLLCDEATSALDPKTTRSILELLKDINKEFGITIVIITHEMSVIQHACDRVAIIEAGEIAEEGSVDEIFTRPKTMPAKRLVFPDQEKTDSIVGKNLIRLVFDGRTSYEPVISNMVSSSGAPVNIMYANIQNVEGVNKGQMVLELSSNKEESDKQIKYLNEEKITYIEIGEVK